MSTSSNTPEIPEDVLRAAEDLANAIGAGLAIGAAATIARAIMTERAAATDREREACLSVISDYPNAYHRLAASIRKSGLR